MNISPSSSISSDQAVMHVNSAQKTTEATDSTTTQLAFGDTVEFSDEAHTLSIQNAAETDSSETATGGNDTSETEATEKSSGAGGSSGSSSFGSSSEETIEDLEEEISALQQEIASLATKAASNKAAKTQPEAKQAELASKNSELLQLEQS